MRLDPAEQKIFCFVHFAHVHRGSVHERRKKKESVGEEENMSVTAAAVVMVGDFYTVKYYYDKKEDVDAKTTLGADNVERDTQGNPLQSAEGWAEVRRVHDDDETVDIAWVYDHAELMKAWAHDDRSRAAVRKALNKMCFERRADYARSNTYQRHFPRLLLLKRYAPSDFNCEFRVNIATRTLKRLRPTSQRYHPPSNVVLLRTPGDTDDGDEDDSTKSDTDNEDVEEICYIPIGSSHSRDRKRAKGNDSSEDDDDDDDVSSSDKAAAGDVSGGNGSGNSSGDEEGGGNERIGKTTVEASKRRKSGLNRVWEISNASLSSNIKKVRSRRARGRKLSPPPAMRTRSRAQDTLGDTNRDPFAFESDEETKKGGGCGGGTSGDNGVGKGGGERKGKGKEASRRTESTAKKNKRADRRLRKCTRDLNDRDADVDDGVDDGARSTRYSSAYASAPAILGLEEDDEDHDQDHDVDKDTGNTNVFSGSEKKDGHKTTQSRKPEPWEQFVDTPSSPDSPPPSSLSLTSVHIISEVEAATAASTSVHIISGVTAAEVPEAHSATVASDKASTGIVDDEGDEEDEKKERPTRKNSTENDAVVGSVWRRQRRCAKKSVLPTKGDERKNGEIETGDSKRGGTEAPRRERAKHSNREIKAGDISSNGTKAKAPVQSRSGNGVGNGENGGGDGRDGNGSGGDEGENGEHAQEQAAEDIDDDEKDGDDDKYADSGDDGTSGGGSGTKNKTTEIARVQKRQRVRDTRVDVPERKGSVERKKTHKKRRQIAPEEEDEEEEENRASLAVDDSELRGRKVHVTCGTSNLREFRDALCSDPALFFDTTYGVRKWDILRATLQFGLGGCDRETRNYFRGRTGLVERRLHISPVEDNVGEADDTDFADGHNVGERKQTSGGADDSGKQTCALCRLKRKLCCAVRTDDDGAPILVGSVCLARLKHAHHFHQLMWRAHRDFSAQGMTASELDTAFNDIQRHSNSFRLPRQQARK
jgi:hypothetical protein